MELIIRTAEPKDILDIYKLVDSYSGIEFDSNKLKNNLRQNVYNANVLIVHYGEKIIGGVSGYVMYCLHNSDVMFCVMLFYVMPEYRFLSRRIIKEIEVALIGTKVTKILFAMMNDYNYEAHKRFMRIMGYKDLETHFVKSVN